MFLLVTVFITAAEKLIGTSQQGREQEFPKFKIEPYKKRLASLVELGLSEMLALKWRSE